MLSVPNIVVREAVHIDLQLAIGIHVHVRNEEYCAMNHLYHHPPNHDELNFIRDIKVRKFTAPTDYFLLDKNILTLLEDVSAKILECIFSQAWHSSRNRSASRLALSVYENPPDLPNYFDKGQRD